MNPDQLLAHFDRISDAPNAIQRLRRFILDLAVRGKLVEQDPEDESAINLLKRVRVAKSKALGAGEIGREKPLLVLVEDQLPFAIPMNWCWSRIAEVGFLNPRNVAVDTVPASFVPMSLISAEYGVANESVVRPWGEIKSGFTHFAEGDVGLAKITPCFENGKSTIFRELESGIGAGTTELHIVRPVLVSSDYILIFLKCPHFIESGIPRMTGTAGQKRVPTEYFANSPFPLPPLAEQHRICAKVDELMALCDRLGAAQREREVRRDRLALASLHCLNHPSNGDATVFREHARFHLEHLARITAHPEQIKQLRQSIRNLAARGQLVLQDPEAEPVSELLNRIQAEKMRLMRAGIIPRQKLSSQEPNELAFKHPEQWEVARFGDVCNVVTSGSRGWAEFYANTGAKFIRAQNIRFGRLQLEELACVNPPRSAEGSRTRVTKGDLFVVITGAGVTNPALLDSEIGEAYVSQHVALIKPTETDLSKWLLLCLMTPVAGRDELVERAYGAGKPGLNLDNIRSLTIPIPPLAEQCRILAKVDELMELCDQLEAKLTTTQTESRRLLEAVLHEALNTATLETA